jgi:anti-sigma factor RsiW
MNCAQAREMLDAFLTGELSETEVQELRTHLDSCEDCREELEETKRFTTTMMELLRPLKPRERFSQKVTERTVRTPGLRRLGGWIALGAAGVVALAASVALLKGKEPAARLGPCVGQVQLFRYSLGE